jgi:endonuclease III
MVVQPTKQQIRRVHRLLTAVYPESTLGNKRNPLDEYLYIYLSLRAHERGFEAAYKGFKRRFQTWEVAFHATRKQIAAAIRPAGLADQKSERIKQTLRIIKSEFGELSLRKLKQLPPEDVESFLARLPGIGVKSARCIMMYSLDFAVLPVDIHVARISARLGWIDGTARRNLHEEVQGLVPPDLRFGLHVRFVQHGRDVCRGQYPKCARCCLARVCERVGVGKASAHEVG